MASGRVFVLGGPTAAGKSALALELAERFSAPVVSADAMTVYRDLDVGTAKPSAAERARVPHHAIDIRNADEDFSVAQFVALVEELAARHPRVVVAGGTPFYLRGLVRPLAPLPPADPTLRAELSALEDLHGALQQVDPSSAARLHPNDTVRLVRALEVYRLTGTPLSVHHARDPGTPRLPLRLAWIDREDLPDRIERRLRGMLTQGYVEETAAVVERFGEQVRPLRSFAYRHLVAHLQGDLTLDEAQRRTGRDTWRFARKQRTFARGMGWSPCTRPGAIEAAEAWFADEGPVTAQT